MLWIPETTELKDLETGLLCAYPSVVVCHQLQNPKEIDIISLTLNLSAVKG